MPSPTRQSSHLPIHFGPAPSTRVVSTEPILDIPFSSGPSEPVLESITSPIRDDDTGGGFFHESPPRPPPATLPRSPTRMATLEAELKATKILHRDTVVLFAKRIKKLESKLKSKKRKLVLTLHDPSVSTTPSKPAHPEQSSEQEISPTTLDAVLTLSQSKARARAATIIYKRLKKQHSSSGLDFTDSAIPADELDSTGGLDSVGGQDSAVAAGPTVPAEPSSPIRDPSKGKAVATPSSPVSALIYLDSLLAQRVAEEQERESMASAAQSAHKQAELDRVAFNLTNEEWISLVDQVQANLTLSAELLGADVSKDTFSIRMVELMNRQRKMIAEMKAKAKREKPMTPAQQKEFMRTFVKNQTKDYHQHLNRSGETLESSESKKLKSSHNTTQPAKLQETTYVSAGATIAAGDPIPAVTSVSAATSIPAVTPIATGVSTTVGASGSASEASVLIIELLDSPRKDTSLPLDLETEEQDATLRKYSRKKSIARRRTLPSAYKPKSDALPFDEDDPDAEFKRYLRQTSNDDKPAEPVSLALVSDITTWEIILTEFGLGEIHVLTRADGTVKWFSTLRELMYWAGRANLMVLYGKKGMLLSYGMIRISGRSGAGDSMPFLLFMCWKLKMGILCTCLWIRIASHPSPDQMPSPPRQSLPPPIPFGPAPTSGVSEPVLETITSPFRDDDTGGGYFHESPPRPHPATLTFGPTVGVVEEPLTLTSLLALFPTYLQRIATLEAELKATKILHKDTVVLFAKRIKKLKSKLKTKKRKLVPPAESSPPAGMSVSVKSKPEEDFFFLRRLYMIVVALALAFD
nr:hypothetical protein [Tanacetum cinerariifolium]